MHDINDTPHGWEWGVKERIYGGQEYYEYAGFLIRLLAQLVDGLILGIISAALLGILIVPTILLAAGSDDDLSSALVFTTCLAEVGVMVVAWLYYAGFESSRFMGTPGKLMCGLRVTDLDGNGISFGKATARYVLKIFLNIFVYIGYLYILVSDKKQGLYDVVAGTMVVKS